jgi:hypothetical protein
MTGLLVGRSGRKRMALAGDRSSRAYISHLCGRVCLPVQILPNLSDRRPSFPVRFFLCLFFLKKLFMPFYFPFVHDITLCKALYTHSIPLLFHIPTERSARRHLYQTNLSHGQLHHNHRSHIGCRLPTPRSLCRGYSALCPLAFCY